MTPTVRDIILLDFGTGYNITLMKRFSEIFKKRTDEK